MTKEEAIKMLQDNIADGENIFISVWSFDVHPTWSSDYTQEDWDFAVQAMEGRRGEYIDDTIANELTWCMADNRVDYGVIQ